ncbi:hypothetical protein HOL24_07195 [bacterium]|jgi:asparagine synthase (glutamine-hydrolysing)|nr:hypothetical protein [bacterium]
MNSHNNLIMLECIGWKYYKRSDYTLWFKGYVTNYKMSELHMELKCIVSNYSKINIDVLKEWIKGVKGHFAIVIDFDGCVFATTDKISSIPLYYVEREGEAIIGNHAPSLKRYANIDSKEKNSDAILEIAMSGYTVGRKTIFNDLYQLTAGECLLSCNQYFVTEYYYTYLPKFTASYDKAYAKKKFSESVLVALTELIENNQGRQIAIPLSDGFDSRLIASGLNFLGAKDVICFSYGSINSNESYTSQAVSNKLGYQWFHVPLTYKSQKEFFSSEDFERYKEDFNSLSSTTFVQDISAIQKIRQNNLISSDAVIVNGNTGDFISGGHIPRSLTKGNLEDNNPDKLLASSWNEFLDKHFSLWGMLRNKNNNKFIINELNSLLESRGIDRLVDNEQLYGVFESMEFLGRQSKYIVNMQRAYEFYGYSWHMPLWSESMLDFWECVPQEYKVNQRLYKDTLYENNWGGVWSDIPINNKLIQPSWLRYIRLLSKILLYPYSKNAWYRFERNVFQYHLDEVKNSVIVPYRKVLLDRRGQRHWLSWLTELYLIENGINDLPSINKRHVK